MKRSAVVFLFLFCLAQACVGDSGVLLPRGKNQPDPRVLSLAEMEIHVVIDNGDARVSIKQIFANHTGNIEEGNYLFALPSRASISDFAVWDGPTRIPAVILERKRAGEIYEQLTAQRIDPGLLQMGERGPDEARKSSVFSAKIAPISPWGTKRLEMEYHETIPVEGLKSFFAIPLHPDAYAAQSAGSLKITFELSSAHDLSNFQQVGTAFPLKVTEKNAHSVKASFQGQNVSLTEDFAVKYDLDGSKADSLNVITYRQPESGQPDPTEMSPVRSHNEPGFFEAQVLLASNATSSKSANGGPAAKTVVILFDNSLSMQWEKLERSYAAMEQALHILQSGDSFNLILFNNKPTAFAPSPVEASRENIQKALDFVRASKLRGGTDLQEALNSALKQFTNKQGSPYLLLITDGGATRGTIQSGRLSKWYADAWKQLPEPARPHTYVFAVGDDANLPLLRMISRTDGAMENVLSTEPVEFKLNVFLSKIGQSPVAGMNLSVAPEAAVQAVYPLQENAFAGSMAAWIGQYPAPAKHVAFTMRGTREGSPLNVRTEADLPALSLEHTQLPRLWAKARIDALLEKVERDGEDQKTVDEIIALARKYKFVTPYTSFLAVPRALLRPRVIRPGDPILRVHTDESIRSVIAIFPFGLTKRLNFLSNEKVWQTRFLAPNDMEDGTYTVRLVLRDASGNTYREQKTFVIASKPPVVTVKLDTHRYRRGDTIPLRATASASTRTLTARLEGAAPVSLRWNAKAGASTGELTVPNDLPAGSYRLTIIAEDIAHNLGTQEVQIEVLP